MIPREMNHVIEVTDEITVTEIVDDVGHLADLLAEGEVATVGAEARVEAAVHHQGREEVLKEVHTIHVVIEAGAHLKVEEVKVLALQEIVLLVAEVSALQKTETNYQADLLHQNLRQGKNGIHKTIIVLRRIKDHHHQLITQLPNLLPSFQSKLPNLKFHSLSL